MWKRTGYSGGAFGQMGYSVIFKTRAVTIPVRVAGDRRSATPISRLFATPFYKQRESIAKAIGGREPEQAGARPHAATEFWIQANLGLALLWDGQPAEAQRVFETVIKADADYLRAYIGLAVALFRQGRVNEAKKVYRELVVMDPSYQPEGWIAQNLNFNPKDSEQFMSDLLAASR